MEVGERLENPEMVESKSIGTTVDRSKIDDRYNPTDADVVLIIAADGTHFRVRGYMLSSVM